MMTLSTLDLTITRRVSLLGTALRRNGVWVQLRLDLPEALL
jgi:hypothetical protein